MVTEDVQKAQSLLLAKLQEDPTATPPASQILNWLISQPVGEEVARVAFWDLIDSRRILLRSDRSLALPPEQRIPAAS